MNSNQISPQEKEQATTSWLPQLSQLRCWSFEVTLIEANFPSLMLSLVDNALCIVASTTSGNRLRILNYIQLCAATTARSPLTTLQLRQAAAKARSSTLPRSMTRFCIFRFFGINIVVVVENNIAYIITTNI